MSLEPKDTRASAERVSTEPQSTRPNGHADSAFELDREAGVTQGVGATQGVALLAKNLVDHIATIVSSPQSDARERMLRQSLEAAQELFGALSEEDPERLEGAIAKVDSACGETELFCQVGRLTRTLHSSIVEFRSQVAPRLHRVMECAVPEAADKLQAVIAMTDQAAHRVLELTERQSKVLRTQREAVQSITSRVLAGEAPTDERTWLATCGQMTQTVLRACAEAEQLNSEILMAQEFQDLSGQMIRKVIALISDVEEGLVQLIRIFGPNIATAAPERDDDSAPAGELAGPDASGSCSQDDVNALLASRGF